MIEFTLPGPPKGKGRPRFSRKTGRAYTPADTVSYEGALKAVAFEAMAGRPPLEGPLDVTVWAYLPIPKSWPKYRKALALEGALRPEGKPDFDNIAKVVDACNEIVWRDDKQIADGLVRKFYSDRPRLDVFVAPAAVAFLE